MKNTDIYPNCNANLSCKSLILPEMTRDEKCKLKKKKKSKENC
jgi:hypothetical protein